MRKIVAGLLMSLDGVVESPEKWGFPYMNKEMTEWIAAGIAKADAVLMGPRTYQAFAMVWRDHELWRAQSGDDLMADFINNSPKYVVSAILETLEWQSATLIKDDLAQELTQLRQQPGKNILIPGSPRLVQSLLRDGLLDELSLNVCPVLKAGLLDEIQIHLVPVLLGGGIRLFDHLGAPPIQLESTRALEAPGVTHLTFRVVK